MNMRLELQKFHVKELKFGQETSLDKGALTINKEEMAALMSEDKHFSGYDIELVSPGEDARIIDVSDVIEPRARRDGGDWPGILDKTVGIVGNGKTDVLCGAALVAIDDDGDNSRDRVRPMGSVIEMTGPGAEYTVFSKTHNICVMPKAAPGVDARSPGFKVAMKTAAIKASVYLAACCRELDPDEVEVYEMPPLTEAALGKEDLPRFVYIFNLYRYYLKEEAAIYGKIYPWMPSMLLHPNEIFDGAVVNPSKEGNTFETYSIQNLPVAKELYSRHGKDLLFLGVIPTVAMLEDCDVQSQANVALKLALQLGADGAVLTKAVGGSPMMDIAAFAVNAGRYGIKSVLIIDDMAAKLPDGRFRNNGIIFTDPGARAIVNTGNTTETFELPAVSRVVGIYKDGADKPIRVSLRGIMGSGTQLGNSMILETKY